MMQDRYHRVAWGDHPRARTSRLNWAGPSRWNRRARQDGARRRVFCASLADVFDNQVFPGWRHDLFAVIAATPHLDWLLLTKRPQNIAAMLPPDWGAGFPNVWLGTTAENQAEAERRIPVLRAIPAAKYFVSCEPLLGPIDLTRLMSGAGDARRAISALHRRSFNADTGMVEERNKIDWVIAGGESGPGARPAHPDWFRWLRDQCSEAGTAFFFKQWGEWLPCVEDDDGARMVCYPDDGSDDRRFDDFPKRALLRVSGQTMWRVGKTTAGATLDGVTHQKFPK